jgi:protein gp37
MAMAARIEAMGNQPRYAGTTRKVNGNAIWTGKIAQAPRETLLAPLRRKKPTTYFVNSMSDLFHEDVPDEWIDQIFAVMALTPRHTYQILTKRAERMRDYCSDETTPFRVAKAIDVPWKERLSRRPLRSTSGIEPYAPVMTSKGLAVRMPASKSRPIH